MTVLMFGATGSAGGSVLDVCLGASDVTHVRAIVRRPGAAAAAKLTWIEHQDFTNYAGLEPLFSGVDACLFCLGKSATQVSDEDAYRRITREFAVAAAAVLLRSSPAAVFHYISGRGAGERSRFMWARVKAEAERELLDRAAAVCWRPGAIDGKPSASEPLVFRIARQAYPLLKPFRSLYVSGDDIGFAMLQATREGMRRRIVENAELRDIAERGRGTS